MEKMSGAEVEVKIVEREEDADGRRSADGRCDLAVDGMDGRSRVQVMSEKLQLAENPFTSVSSSIGAFCLR